MPSKIAALIVGITGRSDAGIVRHSHRSCRPRVGGDPIPHAALGDESNWAPFGGRWTHLRMVAAMMAPCSENA